MRKTLDMLARSGHVHWGSGAEVRVPLGLGFNVRATKTGVNITIEDRGWVDRVTNGDRSKIGEHRHEETEIIAEVDKVRSIMFSPPLPGETKWAPIIISVRAGNTSREGSDISDTDHYDPRLYCAECKVEILRGEDKAEVAGPTPGRIDVLCGPCNHRLLYGSPSADAPLGGTRDASV